MIIKPREIAEIIETLYEQGEYDDQQYAVLTLSKLALAGIDISLFSSRSALISDASEWRRDHPMLVEPKEK